MITTIVIVIVMMAVIIKMAMILVVILVIVVNIIVVTIACGHRLLADRRAVIDCWLTGLAVIDCCAQTDVVESLHHAH